MMSFHKTIKWKILLLLFVSLAGSLLLVGVALSYFIEQQHEDSVSQTFASFFTRAQSVLKETDELLNQSADILSHTPGLVSSLNLINEYSDIRDYQPLVFDDEKSHLATRLSSHARSAGLQHIALYDADDWLVSFSDNEWVHSEQGFVSFQDGKPLLHAQSIDAGDSLYSMPADPFWATVVRRQARETGVYYVQALDNVGIIRVQPVTRTLPGGSSKIIGYLWLMRYLDEALLARIARGSTARYSIQSADGVIVGDGPVVPFEAFFDQAPDLPGAVEDDMPFFQDDQGNYLQVRKLPLTDGGRLLLVASLDHTLMAQQIAQTRSVVLWVLLFTALLVLPVGLLFARRGISQPTEALTALAHQIREGRYDLPMLELDTHELNTVARSLYEAAQTIREREAELRGAYAEMEKRVEARTGDLADTNARLEAEVAERKQAERDLSESRNMLQKVVDHIPQFVFWKDRNSAYLGCNRNFLKAAGLHDVGEIIGKTDYDMPWSREEAESYREMDRRVMENDKEELHIQETIHNANGDMNFVDTNKIPLHTADGEVMGILGTYEDITERVETQKAMMQAKEEAIQANRAKSEFLSRMSHELRTPLNAILGFAQLLQLDSESSLNQRQSEGVGEIRRAGDHLLDLINEILDLARIESGKFEIRAESLDIKLLLSDCLNLAETLLQSRNIRVSCDLPDGPLVWVHADAIRLRQVILNLLSNGVKYNIEGGEIAITVTQMAERQVRISVRDTGVGICEEDQQRLFQPFMRFGNQQDEVEGTGIGLVICKDLVELMGGELGCNSILGMGSEFWFVLPQGEVGSEMEKTPQQVEAEVTETQKHDAEFQVLYVEDNRANISLMKSIMLRRASCHLHVVESAEDGIAYARDHQPDLILMDISLPGINGDEALLILRDDDLTRDIPVIAVSANAMEQDVVRGKEIGFDDYLTKPLDMVRFYEVFDRVVADVSSG